MDSDDAEQEEIIDRVLTPDVILPDQQPRQFKMSGEILLLREVLNSAIIDLCSDNKRLKREAYIWFTTPGYGTITLEMTLNAIGVEDPSELRSIVKKFADRSSLLLTKWNGRLRLRLEVENKP